MPPFASSWNVGMRKITYTSSAAAAQNPSRGLSGAIFFNTNENATSGAFPLIVLCHGAEYASDAAPSTGHSFENGNAASLIYRTGGVVFMPDYPGMGDDSTYQYQTFVVAESVGQAVLDGIPASLQAMSQLGISWDGRVFVLGYSEGGFVVVAAMNQYNNGYLWSQIPHKIWFAAADGPHDMSGTMSYELLADPTLSKHPWFVMTTLRSYSGYYPGATDLLLANALNPSLFPTPPNNPTFANTPDFNGLYTMDNAALRYNKGGWINEVSTAGDEFSSYIRGYIGLDPDYTKGVTLKNLIADQVKSQYQAPSSGNQGGWSAGPPGDYFKRNDNWRTTHLPFEPFYLFHASNDNVIYYKNSVALDNALNTIRNSSGITQSNNYWFNTFDCPDLAGQEIHVLANPVFYDTIAKDYFGSPLPVISEFFLNAVGTSNLRTTLYDADGSVVQYNGPFLGPTVNVYASVDQANWTLIQQQAYNSGGISYRPHQAGGLYPGDQIAAAVIYLKVADAANESNFVSAPVNFYINKPDLQIVSYSANQAPRVDLPQVYTFGVQNKGYGTVPAQTKIRLVLEENQQPIVDNQGRPVYGELILADALGPQGYVSLQTNSNGVYQPTLGIKQLTGVLQPANTNLTQNNKALSFTTTIRPPLPDFVITNTRLDTNGAVPTAGIPFDVYATISNVGEVANTADWIGIGATDMVGTGVVNFPPPGVSGGFTGSMQPGQSVEVKLSSSPVTYDGYGNHSIRLEVDDQHRITELSDSNNFSVINLYVSKPTLKH
jgi:hypothetical protein